MWRTAIAVDSSRPNGEDRAAVVPFAAGLIAVVADGVGGRSGGGAAADAVVAAVHRLAANPGPFDFGKWLRDLDREMAESGTVGETTAVVARLTDLGPIGVACGDSVAWAVTADGYRDLTAGAGEKPWIGSGAARPVSFLKPRQHVGTLLFATDGLVKYTSPERICAIIRGTPFADAPRALIEAVRYPSGRLPDDVAVILAEWDGGSAVTP